LHKSVEIDAHADIASHLGIPVKVDGFDQALKPAAGGDVNIDICTQHACWRVRSDDRNGLSGPAVQPLDAPAADYSAAAAYTDE